MSDTLQKRQSLFRLCLAFMAAGIGCLCLLFAEEKIMGSRIAKEQTALLGRIASAYPEEAAGIAALMLDRDVAAEDAERGTQVLAAGGYGEMGRAALGKSRAVRASAWFLAALCAVFPILYAGAERRKRKRETEWKSLMVSFGVWTTPGEEGGDDAEIRQPELRRAAEDLREAARGIRAERLALRDERDEMQRYLENIAHQIKTPLAGVSLCQEFLEGSEEDPDKRRMLNECGKKIEAIQEMIRILLRSARLSARHAPFTLVRCPLSRLLDGVRRDVLPFAEEKRLTVEAPVESEIACDEFWLREALACLVKNAAFYTPPGGEVLLQVLEEKDAVIFFVKDHGPGIPEAEQEDIFRRFYTRELRSTEGNAGIGLNLAWRIARRHGGKLTLVPHEGGGAWFALRLPEGSGKQTEMGK